MDRHSSIFRMLMTAGISFISVGTAVVEADDWPQWRGPRRDGVSTETGLGQTWPPAGPPLVWKTEGLGTGYSSVAVSKGRLFTMGNDGRDEYIVALSLDDGEELWRTSNGGAYRNDRGSGPRSTPTIDGNLLYALGANGDLACLRVTDGEPVWRVNILKRFGSKNISWGMSESVLVEGGAAICSPGGHNRCVVALDKKTGRTLWTSKGLSDLPGYASAMAVTVGGVRQIVHFTNSSTAGVRASDGAFLWQYERASNDTANCTTPIIWDNLVFVTSGYGKGCALLELSSSNNKTTATEVYFNKVIKNHHGGVVLVDGKIYGSSNRFVCMDMRSGELNWRTRELGKCSLIYADGHLYCLTENGVMALVEATPKSYVEKSRFRFKQFSHFKTGSIGEEEEKPTWAHPVIAHKKLFLRDEDHLYCYDIAETTQAAIKP